MKAYSELADELGRRDTSNGNDTKGKYVSKMKGGSCRVSPRGGGGGGNRHFVADHTGRSHLATRKLSKTVSDGSYGQISHLLSQGANPKVSDNKGRTPLHFAAVRGKVEIVQLLLSHGALVNEQDNIGNTPLHLACVGGHVGVVTALLKAGTNLMVTDTRGSTPLHLALSRLRMLDSSSSMRNDPTSQRKIEIEKIINMIREYLRVGCEGGECADSEDEEECGVLVQIKGKTKDVEELEALASRLNLSENEEQVDEISALLLNFTELSIQKRTQSAVVM